MKYCLGLFLALWPLSLRADDEITLRGMVVCPQHRHLYLGRDQIAKDPDGDLWCIYAVGGSPAVAEKFRKSSTITSRRRGSMAMPPSNSTNRSTPAVKYYIDALTDVLKGIRHDYGGCAMN